VSTHIDGKIIVLTGASSGLGEAAARHLSSLGATIVLGARRIDRIRALAKELIAAGGKAIAVATDVTHFEQVQRLVDTAVQTYGRVDVLINNAGVMPQSPLDRRKIDDWNRAIDVNIKGVLYGIGAVLPTMQAQRSGHIINVSSSPGAVDTELTDSITEADVADATKKFYAEVAVPADSFARAVAFAIEQPADIDINEILYRPTRQEY